MPYPILRQAAGIALRWYYREVAVVGAERIPTTGPVLLVVNHFNALVDALVIGWVVPRRIRITAKAVLFDNPLLGAFLRSVGIIPLRRTSDELARRRAGAHRTASEPAAAADPARNAASFEAIVAALDAGAAVLIFPEGKSHDEPMLAPLRTGPARLALAARDAGKAVGLHIVPIGLVFESKATVRSRVVAVVGDPIEVDAWTSATEHPAAELTALIADRLGAVVLTAPTQERLEQSQWLARQVAAILAPAAPPLGAEPSLVEEYTIAARVVRGLDTLESMPPDVQRMAAHALRDVEALARDLEAAGIAPTDAVISLRTVHGARFVVRELALLAAVGPLALWGRLTHWVPFHLARTLALRDVTANDQPAMRTIVLGLLFVLLSYVVQAGIVLALVGWLPALAYLLVLPIAADVDLRYSDRLRAAWGRMRAYLRLRNDRALGAELTERRRRLAGEIRELDARVQALEGPRPVSAS